MILGDGMIAKALSKYDHENILFMAFGVSDSKNTDISAYDRESLMIRNYVEKYNDKIIVFFSTFSINDPLRKDDLYVSRKRLNERYILDHAKRYLILRVSNIVGNTGNSKNIFNFLYQNIRLGNPFTLWANCKRNLLTTHDFGKIVNHILTNELESRLNTIINVTNSKSVTIREIVEAIEKHLDKKGIYTIEDFEDTYPIIDEKYSEWFKVFNIDQDGYIDTILAKFFPKD